MSSAKSVNAASHYALERGEITSLRPRPVRTSAVGSVVTASMILLGGGSKGGYVRAQSAPSPSFAPAKSYGVGMGAESVAVGDFNGDGKLDLAVAYQGMYAGGYNYSGVSVLLGNGDGTFQPAVNYASGNNSFSVAVGDFNRDGRLDLAVANLASADISVLLGNGDGSFQPAINYAAGGGVVSVAVGDFNGDGNLDLATNISILLGNGDGTFQRAAYYLMGNVLLSVVVGDYNGDGKLDLVTAYNHGTEAGFTNGTVSVSLGRGDGTFQTAVSYDAGWLSFAVAVGDFNGDGKPDLAVADAGLFFFPIPSSVSVLLGKGDGTFQSAVEYDIGGGALGAIVAAVAVGDFNCDGNPDLAVTFASQGDDVWVMLGNGDGTFQAPINCGTGPTPGSIAVGDLNGDGKADLITANYGSSLGQYLDASVSVLLNTCGSSGPQLSLVRSDANAILSWPLASTGFALESTTNLSLTNWQSAVETPVTNNGLFEVAMPLDPSQRFFRLRKP